MTAKATKTIKQTLIYKPRIAEWMNATQGLFNQVVAFYFEVIQAHPGVLSLSNREAQRRLEHLTHATKDHPHPVMLLSDIAENVPAIFRRAAINAALGSAHSFHTHLAKWHKQKERTQAKGKKYTIRSPVPPRTWRRPVAFHAGMWKERGDASIMLKLWTGSSWAWVKVGVQGRSFPDDWTPASPQLVQHDKHWYLHTPLEREQEHPKKVAT